MIAVVGATVLFVVVKDAAGYGASGQDTGDH